jgi:hypothetical protein
MNADHMLIEAQMHLECINEAFIDMAPAMQQLTSMDGQEVLKTTWAEVNARVWAAIHLVQSVRMGRPDEQLADALMQANAFNRDSDSPPAGLH